MTWSVGLIVLLIGLCPLYSGSQFKEPEVFGSAILVEGEVLLSRGVLDFETKESDHLFFDDIVRTGEDGRAVLKFKHSYISIGSNTAFKLRKKNHLGKEITSIELYTGQIRSKLEGDEKEFGFQVEHQLGTVHFLGTDVVTESMVGEEGDGTGFAIHVLEGRVRLDLKVGENLQISESKMMKANQSSQLYYGKKPMVKALPSHEKQIRLRKLRIPELVDVQQQEVPSVKVVKKEQEVRIAPSFALKVKAIEEKPKNEKKVYHKIDSIDLAYSFEEKAKRRKVKEEIDLNWLEGPLIQPTQEIINKPLDYTKQHFQIRSRDFLADKMIDLID